MHFYIEKKLLDKIEFKRKKHQAVEIINIEYAFEESNKKSIYNDVRVIIPQVIVL